MSDLRTTAADPNPEPQVVPLWYTPSPVLLPFKAFPTLKWTILRIRCSLKRINVYTGKLVFNLFVYVEQPICRTATRTRHLVTG